jgi:heptosyltransferase-1
MRNIEKILLVRLGSLGDLMHALPAQQYLHRRFPDSEIHWLTDQYYASLLKCVPGLDRIWVTDLRSLSAGIRSLNSLVLLVRDLRKQKFDLSFDFQGLLKSAVLARLSGARRLRGFTPERFKEKGSEFFYDEQIGGEGDLKRHVIDGNLELVGKLAGQREASPEIKFQIPRPDENHIKEELKRREIRNPILINPGAGWVTKRWPAQKYGRLAGMLIEKLRVPVVVTYGPGEESLVDSMRTACPQGELIAFPTTIVQLIALCLRSRLMIAGDCGPLHLAVASSTPTVAIMGPTSPSRNGPYSPQDEVVKRSSPCSNSYRRKRTKLICMDIKVESVFDAVLHRLAKIKDSSIEDLR